MTFGDTDRHILYELLRLVRSLQQQEMKIMATAQEVLSAVQDETTVEQSVIALLDQIAGMLQAAKTDPAVLDQVVSLIAANKQAMADAVTRNTPAEGA